jgi:uncharacterized protein with HEPN domain
MPRNAEFHLRELEGAAQYLMGKSKELSLEEYLRNKDLRFMVERSFIHIGEVMAQLRREFPSVAVQFEEASRIVDFRNFIIHRYWEVDDTAVYLTLTTRVQPFLSAVEVVLRNLSPTSQ